MLETTRISAILDTISGEGVEGDLEYQIVVALAVAIFLSIVLPPLVRAGRTTQREKDD
jgi:hypothetical protein